MEKPAEHPKANLQCGLFSFVWPAYLPAALDCFLCVGRLSPNSDPAAWGLGLPCVWGAPFRFNPKRTQTF